MRLILLSLLTLVLVGCGEIRLEVGEDDSGYVGEVGTYAWMPQPDVVHPTGGVQQSAYLVNTRTGVVQSCLKYVTTDSEFLCVFVARTIEVDR
jgi:uncharacterized protein YceK